MCFAVQMIFTSWFILIFHECSTFFFVWKGKKIYYASFHYIHPDSDGGITLYLSSEFPEL